MPKGIPLTEEEQNLRRRQVFEAAVHLFVKKGFLETSMREIAEEAGVGKSTLYDYFKTKDDVLVYYFEQELAALICLSEEICRKVLPADEKLRQILNAHLEYLLANKKDYIQLSIEVQRLGMQTQARLQTSRHAYQDLITGLIAEGIAQGCFRKVDPYLTMRLILAALGPVVFSTRPTGTPQEMLNAVLDILFSGIKA
jgi:TetR/AcrR family transcriptional regulator, cholesterol catabolism regulator